MKPEMGKRQHNYYAMLKGLVEYSQKAARTLQEILENYDVQKLPERMDYMHSIEHAADQAKHEMADLLVKEFITPIDREDIIALSQEIDNITDAVEDVLLRLYMFNIQIIRPDAFRFAELIVACCDELVKLMGEFENYKKSETIQQSVVEVNRLEGEGDRLYTGAIRGLYTSSYSPTEIYAWTAIFDHMEKCCDACEHTGEGVQMVIMKNS